MNGDGITRTLSLASYVCFLCSLLEAFVAWSFNVPFWGVGGAVQLSFLGAGVILWVAEFVIDRKAKKAFRYIGDDPENKKIDG